MLQKQAFMHTPMDQTIVTLLEAFARRRIFFELVRVATEAGEIAALRTFKDCHRTEVALIYTFTKAPHGWTMEIAPPVAA